MTRPPDGGVNWLANSSSSRARVPRCDRAEGKRRKRPTAGPPMAERKSSAGVSSAPHATTTWRARTATALREPLGSMNVAATEVAAWSVASGKGRLWIGKVRGSTGSNDEPITRDQAAHARRNEHKGLFSVPSHVAPLIGHKCSRQGATRGLAWQPMNTSTADCCIVGGGQGGCDRQVAQFGFWRPQSLDGIKFL